MNPEKYKHKTLLLKQNGEIYQLVDKILHDDKEEQIKWEDKQIRTGNSRILDQYGKFIYLYDIEKSKPIDFKTIEGRKVDGGISDALERQELTEKLIRKMGGETSPVEKQTLLMGLLGGIGLGVLIGAVATHYFVDIEVFVEFIETSWDRVNGIGENIIENNENIPDPAR